ncbi:outer membrane beta-barrel protein [Carboxylicivirga sp. A043]|uniref:type IX secretion system protein PorG n=1 Tax=Carboxylicivirga litoralis TaxID=2816963 RepID=UPI0021CAE445|nr:porin family protein [Carboxylicivirga sp. A043]MCU4154904.1 outer membrane beta-barrel protein [Carboxylicivirga sp. A043]
MLAVCTLFQNHSIEAQDRLELGAFVGSSYYFGDLSTGVPFANSHVAAGGIGRYVFTDRIALKAMALYGTISGDYHGQDLKYLESTPNANYSFKRSIGDVSAQIELNFRSYDHKFISTTTFTPYISFGLATTIYNRIDTDVENSAGKPSFILSLPFGIGAKYKINKYIRVGAEWTFRKTFVDDLDYMGEGSVDPSDPYGFGESTFTHNNDWISFAGVYVTISMLKRKTKCNDGIK